MKKQSVYKLDFFLSSLLVKLTENIEYFCGIEIKSKSGTKDFVATIKFQENEFILKYQADTKKLNINSLKNEIMEYVKMFDSVVISYFERGTKITIKANDENVKMKTDKLLDQSIIDKFIENTKSRNYYIKSSLASDLLKTIGIMGSNNKIKNDMFRKYNQLDYFIELIDKMIKNLIQNEKNITIVDCGCGKSYLTFALNYYIKEVLKKSCYFIGIDNSQKVIDECLSIAQKLGYHNMEFIRGNIINYKINKKIQMIISLHACDTATDQAIAFGINHNVKSMVIVPCCHSEFLSQYKFSLLKPIIKHGMLKSRFADILTDGMRGLFLEKNGYNVKMVEYVSPIETPKNLMIRAEKTQKQNINAQKEYNQLKKIIGVSPILESLVIN